jgi:hypothetical protein
MEIENESHWINLDPMTDEGTPTPLPGQTPDAPTPTPVPPPSQETEERK